MSKLSTLLKEARAQSGLTQEQLAKKAANGLTANDVSSYLQGLGFTEVEIRKDDYGKDRFLKAKKI